MKEGCLITHNGSGTLSKATVARRGASLIHVFFCCWLRPGLCGPVVRRDGVAHAARTTVPGVSGDEVATSGTAVAVAVGRVGVPGPRPTDLVVVAVDLHGISGAAVLVDLFTFSGDIDVRVAAVDIDLDVPAVRILIDDLDVGLVFDLDLDLAATCLLGGWRVAPLEASLLLGLDLDLRSLDVVPQLVHRDVDRADAADRGARRWSSCRWCGRYSWGGLRKGILPEHQQQAEHQESYAISKHEF